MADLTANVAAGVRRTLAIVKSSDTSLSVFFAADASALTRSGNEIQAKMVPLLRGTEENALFDRVMKARAGYFSTEQSAGIEQVNRAIASMDEATPRRMQRWWSRSPRPRPACKTRLDP